MAGAGARHKNSIFYFCPTILLHGLKRRVSLNTTIGYLTTREDIQIHVRHRHPPKWGGLVAKCHF
jgi:hypothetical protein